MMRFPLGIPQNGWFTLENHMIFGMFGCLMMFGVCSILFNLVQSCSILFTGHCLGLVHPWHLRLTPNFSELLAHLFHSLLQGSSIVLGRRLILNTKTGSFLNIQTNKNTGKSHFIQKFTGKCRAPEPRTTLCARLRSRNALEHFTRATSYGNV